MPINDEPEVFGMHENANIAFQVCVGGNYTFVTVSVIIQLKNVEIFTYLNLSIKL